MLVGSTVVEGVTGGELRGGGDLGWFGVFELRWSLVESEALGSSARTRGSEWWRWMGEGVPGCLELGLQTHMARWIGSS